MENGMGPGTGTMGGAVGSMTPDGLASGWQYIPYEKDGVKGRAWYHFDRTGRMTTGWYQGLNTCWYYLAESGPVIGRLVTGWFTDPATGKRHYLREDPPDTGRMAVGWYYHLKDHQGIEVGHTYKCFVRYNHIGKYHIVLAPADFFRQKSEVKKIMEEFGLVKGHDEFVRWSDAYRWT